MSSVSKVFFIEFVYSWYLVVIRKLYPVLDQEISRNNRATRPLILSPPTTSSEHPSQSNHDQLEHEQTPHHAGQTTPAFHSSQRFIPSGAPNTARWSKAFHTSAVDHPPRARVTELDLQIDEHVDRKELRYVAPDGSERCD